VQSSQHVFEGGHVFESYGVPEDIMLGAFNIFPKNYFLQHLPMFCTQHITNNKVNRRGMVLHQWVSNFVIAAPFADPKIIEVLIVLSAYFGLLKLATV